MMHMRLAALWFLATANLVAADWPQWRGPFFNGSTTETNLPASWDATKHLRWVLPTPGPSAATPVIADGRVFLVAAEKTAQQVLALAVNATNGQLLWSRVLSPDSKVISGNNDMASPSPVTDGKSVWFMTGTGVLTAFTVDGQLLWRRDLAEDGAFAIQHGYSSSPLLFDGRLYIVVMQNDNPQRYGQNPGRKGPFDSYLLALDSATGKTLWKQVRPTNATDESRESYITPYPFVWKQRREIVLAGGECVTGHDAVSGAELWRWWFSPSDRQTSQHTDPTPVGLEDLLFVIRPQRRPLFALRPEGRGVLGDSVVAWKYEENRGWIASPLVYKGRLYVLQEQERALVCLEPRTGRLLWRQQLPVRVPLQASPTGADDKIYGISLLGEVVALAADDDPRLLGLMPMAEPLCRSTIAVANGRLYVRTARHLYCVGYPAAASGQSR